MLNLVDMQLALSHVKYKDGWTLEVYQGRWEGPHMIISVEVPDSTTGETTCLNIHSMVPPCENVDQFLYWVLWRIVRIEIHEAREFFKYYDHVWDDPHASNANEDRL